MERRTRTFFQRDWGKGFLGFFCTAIRLKNTLHKGRFLVGSAEGDKNPQRTLFILKQIVSDDVERR